MSTKKAVRLLQPRAWRLFHILGRPPDVYQINFFTSKAPFFTVFLRFSAIPNGRQGA
jgi:hypothetical protein